MIYLYLRYTFYISIIKVTKVKILSMMDSRMKWRIGRSKHELDVLYLSDTYIAKEKRGRIQFQMHVIESPNNNGLNKREVCFSLVKIVRGRYVSSPQDHLGSLVPFLLFLCHSKQQTGSRGRVSYTALTFRVWPEVHSHCALDLDMRSHFTRKDSGKCSFILMAICPAKN